ncbi:hypothetical protein AK812_SmicGene43202 [Symbiodinium microadriaticum]|uniref:NADAR domain-containing protein n=1 Tax=Symbiodinium microadriaticum TaxID=2951 RepID=A0A1Q9C1L4_SYMMI|nr:hypothetical protein AK812_SmicGene43202 [Symbiodinium microadriaticum]CAE7871574.1 unnamed protein product [Symbiodinium microadriaticum]CAE7942235.1 unnamed protein product [Symbiodinium sp. KB8]
MAESSKPDLKVLGFYGHGPASLYREFSNFFESPAFRFRLPLFARHDGWDEVVSCRFSEKAIMLMKAALMNDKASFDKIKACNKPAEAKALGRKVAPFDAVKWNEHVREVALEACLQKFASSEELKKKLLDTGDVVIAEATAKDKIWGIGLNVGDERVQDPALWQGKNILGEALMRTREHLRNKVEASGSSVNTEDERTCQGVEEPPKKRAKGLQPPTAE